MELTFREELCNLLNKYNKESPSNTPDFILATYVQQCLEAFNVAVTSSRSWHSGIDQFTPPPTVGTMNAE